MAAAFGAAGLLAKGLSKKKKPVEGEAPAEAAAAPDAGTPATQAATLAKGWGGLAPMVQPLMEKLLAKKKKRRAGVTDVLTTLAGGGGTGLGGALGALAPKVRGLFGG